jgi:hypothetical protein
MASFAADRISTNTARRADGCDAETSDAEMQRLSSPRGGIGLSRRLADSHR